MTDFWGSKVDSECVMVISCLPILQFIMIKIGSFVTAKRFRKFLIPETSILESIHVKVKPQNRSFTFLENLDFEFFHEFSCSRIDFRKIIRFVTVIH